MSELRIQVGKSYKTRSGKRAEITKERSSEWLEGRVIGDPQPYFTWRKNGRYCTAQECGLDLVSEWEEPLKIEAGKYYKTRGGKKAYVACIVLPNPFEGPSIKDQFPVRHVIDQEVGCWYCRADGRLQPGKDDAYDLVAEWKEPEVRVRKLKMVRCPDGTIRVIGGDDRYLGSDPDAEVISTIQVTMKEGVFWDNAVSQ